MVDFLRLPAAVDEHMAATHLHHVAADCDDALDQPGAGIGRIEYDDVTARDGSTVDQLYLGEWDVQAVGPLVDDDPVARQERRLHRAGRNEVVIRQRSAEHEQEEQAKQVTLVASKPG